MRFLRYIFCALLFVTASVAETININWINGDETYAQTTCEIGGDIILPSPPTKRGYTFKGWVAGYTRLEYIESTGTQYIDVGKVGNSTYNYKLTYQKTEANNPAPLFGALMGSIYNTGAYFALSYVSSTRTDAVCYFSDYVHDVPYSESYYKNGLDTNKHTFECTPITQTAYIDGNTWRLQSATTTIEWETTLPLVLFSANKPTGTSINKQKLKVWEFSAQKPNGEYDFNLIPAKRDSDNVVGMYDTVSGQFFTNAGTGEFIAGPVAEIFMNKGM